ncbi:uncharacterized protein LOC116620348 [Nematostella vectensis]|uniref:uncharacterized protein LOC116620348 n=1 Tax=Nematostella vectensis TaxID=45351 RepID=UPI0020773A4F|nr:uncharacterized protein LOC116620348 [Nematostella vectensis]
MSRWYISIDVLGIIVFCVGSQTFLVTKDSFSSLDHFAFEQQFCKLHSNSTSLCHNFNARVSSRSLSNCPCQCSEPARTLWFDSRKMGCVDDDVIRKRIGCQKVLEGSSTVIAVVNDTSFVTELKTSLHGNCSRIYQAKYRKCFQWTVLNMNEIGFRFFKEGSRFFAKLENVTNSSLALVTGNILKFTYECDGSEICLLAKIPGRIVCSLTGIKHDQTSSNDSLIEDEPTTRTFLPTKTSYTNGSASKGKFQEPKENDTLTNVIIGIGGVLAVALLIGLFVFIYRHWEAKALKARKPRKRLSPSPSCHNKAFHCQSSLGNIYANHGQTYFNDNSEDDLISPDRSFYKKSIELPTSGFPESLISFQEENDESALYASPASFMRQPPVSPLDPDAHNTCATLPRLNSLVERLNWSTPDTVGNPHRPGSPRNSPFVITPDSSFYKKAIEIPRARSPHLKGQSNDVIDRLRFSTPRDRGIENDYESLDEFCRVMARKRQDGQRSIGLDAEKHSQAPTCIVASDDHDYDDALMH